MASGDEPLSDLLGPVLLECYAAEVLGAVVEALAALFVVRGGA